MNCAQRVNKSSSPSDTKGVYKMEKIMYWLGFDNFCVTFTAKDTNGNSIGMFCLYVYAISKSRAIEKANRFLIHHTIYYVGEWEIDAERV